MMMMFVKREGILVSMVGKTKCEERREDEAQTVGRCRCRCRWRVRVQVELQLQLQQPGTGGWMGATDAVSRRDLKGFSG